MRLPPQVHQFAAELAELGLGPDVIGAPGDLRLDRSMCGLKHAGLLWGAVAKSDLESVGFKQSLVE